MTQKDELLKVLSTSGNIRPRDLALSLGYPTASVRKYLRELCYEGKAEAVYKSAAYSLYRVKPEETQNVQVL